jgi:hypothetical protein
MPEGVDEPMLTIASSLVESSPPRSCPDHALLGRWREFFQTMEARRPSCPRGLARVVECGGGRTSQLVPEKWTARTLEHLPSAPFAFYTTWPDDDYLCQLTRGWDESGGIMR